MDLLLEEIQEVLLMEKVDVDAMLADLTDPARLEKWYRELLKMAGEYEALGEDGFKKNAEITTQTFSKMIKNDVEKVKSWKRDDRVQVGIRHIKFMVLFLFINSTLENKDKAAEFIKTFKFVRKIDSNALESMISIAGLNLSYEQIVTNSIDNITNNYFSLNIAEIQNYTFDPKKTLGQNILALSELLDEHNEKWQGWAQVDEDAGEKIVKYYKPQKLAWFNLNTAYCPKEQEAMGHCGNSPRSYTDDVIYSLSTIKQRHDKVWFRQPHVTAILEDDGRFGEIRGKQNARPVDKYGPYIKDLMLLDGVKGIKGPRWPEEEGNWTWDDFTEEQQEEILAAKPDFAFEESIGGAANTEASRYINGDDFDPNELRDEIGYLNYVSINGIESNGDFIIDTGLSIGDFIQNNSYITESLSVALDVIEYVYPPGMDEVDAEVLHEERINYFNDMLYEACGVRNSEDIWESFKRVQEELQYNPRPFLGQFIHENQDFFRRFYAEIMDQEEFDFITPDQKTQRIINAIYKNLESKGVFEENDGMPSEFDILLKNAMKTLAENVMAAYGVEDTDRTIDDLDLDRADMIIRKSRSQIADYAIDYIDYEDITAAEAITAILDRDFKDELESWDPDIEFETVKYQRLFDLLFDPSAYRMSKSAEIELKTKIEQAFKK